MHSCCNSIIPERQQGIKLINILSTSHTHSMAAMNYFDSDMSNLSVHI